MQTRGAFRLKLTALSVPDGTPGEQTEKK